MQNADDTLSKDTPEEEEGNGSPAPAPESDNQKLEFVLDIPLEFSVELGKAKMPVSELLGLKIGSTIELDKLAGEPMEIFINRKLVARGEIVVIKENLGVRLTDIITPIERIRGRL